MAFRLYSNIFRTSKYALTLSSKYSRNFSTQRTMAQHAEEHFDTMPELIAKLSKKMGGEISYKPIANSRAHLSKYLVTSQSELPPRAMKDSFLVGIIPLSSDPDLQDKYITFLGHVRVGRLLEDMDIFAVMVAQKHIQNPKLPEDVPLPQTLVTALVDRIDFSDFVPKICRISSLGLRGGDFESKYLVTEGLKFGIPPHLSFDIAEHLLHYSTSRHCLKSKADIKISGHVSWVGKSSMEVVVWLEQKLNGIWHQITRALFLIAARDPTSSRPALVNPIAPADDRETIILAGGEERKRRRLQVQKQQQFGGVIPDEAEQKLIHDLYLRTKVADDVSLKNVILPPRCVWMDQYTLTNTQFSHPEHRNLHNTVFGGFIMRMASEISWILGYKFSKYRPIIKSISDINFARPIRVNSLFTLTAHVVYTQLQYIQVTVYVEADDPDTGISGTTNTFHFTFEVPEMVREVVPKTYHEAMMYIDGRRHFLENMKIEAAHTTFLSEEGVSHKGKL